MPSIHISIGSNNGCYVNLCKKRVCLILSTAYQPAHAERECDWSNVKVTPVFADWLTTSVDLRPALFIRQFQTAHQIFHRGELRLHEIQAKVEAFVEPRGLMDLRNGNPMNATTAVFVDDETSSVGLL
jgi:hypothetical protein